MIWPFGCLKAEEERANLYFSLDVHLLFPRFKYEYISKSTFLSVNVFNTKVLTGDTIFTSATLRGHPSHAKAVPYFLSYLKTLSIGPAPGIEPTTSRSTVTVRRSIN